MTKLKAGLAGLALTVAAVFPVLGSAVPSVSAATSEEVEECADPNADTNMWCLPDGTPGTVKPIDISGVPLRPH